MSKCNRWRCVVSYIQSVCNSVIFNNWKWPMFQEGIQRLRMSLPVANNTYWYWTMGNSPRPKSANYASYRIRSALASLPWSHIQSIGDRNTARQNWHLGSAVSTIGTKKFVSMGTYFQCHITMYAFIFELIMFPLLHCQCKVAINTGACSYIGSKRRNIIQGNYEKWNVISSLILKSKWRNTGCVDWG